jgi:hypothetical protein
MYILIYTHIHIHTYIPYIHTYIHTYMHVTEVTSPLSISSPLILTKKKLKIGHNVLDKHARAHTHTYPVMYIICLFFSLCNFYFNLVCLYIHTHKYNMVIFPLFNFFFVLTKQTESSKCITMSMSRWVLRVPSQLLCTLPV